MTLVGPTPVRPEFHVPVARVLPEYSKRLLVRPGLVSLAHLVHDSATDLFTTRVHLAYDLYYIYNAGFFLDLRILACALFVVSGIPSRVSGKALGLPICVEDLMVASLRVKTIQEMTGIPGKLQGVMSKEAALAPDFERAMTHFMRSSLFVDQYLSLRGAHRRADALGQAVAELGALGATLPRLSRRRAARLSRIVLAWRSLLRIEEKAQQLEMLRSERPIPNPYVFGNPVVCTTGNTFVGRKDVACQVAHSVSCSGQIPTILLHGPRRMGKTSILNQLPRLLGPDFAPAIVDCQDPAAREDLGTLLSYTSRAIVESLRRRGVSVSGVDVPSGTERPFSAFDGWLDYLMRSIPEQTRIILCLDEYESLGRLAHLNWAEAYLEKLRHIAQHRSRIGVLFAGTHTFEKLGPLWTDLFIGSRRIRMSFLSRDEALPLLTDPVPDFDLTYRPEALDAVLERTNCQPFLLQAVASQLVDYLNGERRREATTCDVDRAIAHAIVSGGEYFAYIWKEVGERGQAVLCTLATGGRVEDAASQEYALLREEDVLDGRGELAIPMLGLWVREKMCEAGHAIRHLDE
jgi:hypothetical protein